MFWEQIEARYSGYVKEWANTWDKEKTALENQLQCEKTALENQLQFEKTDHQHTQPLLIAKHEHAQDMSKSENEKLEICLRSSEKHSNDLEESIAQ